MMKRFRNVDQMTLLKYLKKGDFNVRITVFETSFIDEDKIDKEWKNTIVESIGNNIINSIKMYDVICHIDGKCCVENICQGTKIIEDIWERLSIARIVRFDIKLHQSAPNVFKSWIIIR